MSSIVAASPYLFAQAGSFPAPFEYDVPASLEVQPTAATATFDGTNAAGPFLACLSFYSQSGQLLSRTYPQRSIAAGDVAQVSYAPFPGGMTSGGGGGGGTTINFELDGALVGTEPTLNFQDADSLGWTVTDDPIGSVVNVSGEIFLWVEGNGAFVGSEYKLDFEDTASVTWAITDDPGNNRVQLAATASNPALQTERLAQTSVTAAGAGVGVLVPWARSSGAALIDLTTPTKPKIVADGVYALTLWLGWDQTGGSPAASYVWNAFLVTDPTGTNANLAALYGYPHTRTGAAIFQSAVTLSFTGFLAAATVLGVFVQNFSGGNLNYGFDWPNGAGLSTIQQLA